MKRTNTQSLGQVVREFVISMNISSKLKEASISEEWEDLLGRTFTKYTRNLKLSKGILYVEITSSVVKAELTMMREEIRKKLNERAGEEIIHKIIFK